MGRSRNVRRMSKKVVRKLKRKIKQKTNRKIKHTISKKNNRRKRVSKKSNKRKRRYSKKRKTLKRIRGGKPGKLDKTDKTELLKQSFDVGGLSGSELPPKETDIERNTEDIWGHTEDIERHTEDIRAYQDANSIQYEYNVIEGELALIHYKDEIDRGILPIDHNFKNYFSCITPNGTSRQVVIGCKGLYYGPIEGYDLRAIRDPLEEKDLAVVWGQTFEWPPANDKNKENVSNLLKNMGWEDSIDKLWEMTCNSSVYRYRGISWNYGPNALVNFKAFSEAFLKHEKELRQEVEKLKLIPYGLISTIQILLPYPFGNSPYNSPAIKVILKNNRKKHIPIIFQDFSIALDPTFLNRREHNDELWEMTPGEPINWRPWVDACEYVCERLNMKLGEFRKKMNLPFRLLGKQLEPEPQSMAIKKPEAQSETYTEPVADVIRKLASKLKQNPKMLEEKIKRMNENELVEFLVIECRDVRIFLKNEVMKFWNKEHESKSEREAEEEEKEEESESESGSESE